MKFFLLIMLTLIISCNQKKEVAISVNHPSKFTKLLDQFKVVNVQVNDTLHVFTSMDSGTFMNGVPLNKKYINFFPKEIAADAIADLPGIYPICKFKIDSNRMALIARTAAEYDATSVKLFLFDKIKDSITSYIELAESTGDEGLSYIKESFLFKNVKHELLTLILEEETDDHSVNDEKDTTIEIHKRYNLLNLNKSFNDTLIKDAKQIGLLYPHLSEILKSFMKNK